MFDPLTATSHNPVGLWLRLCILITHAQGAALIKHLILILFQIGTIRPAVAALGDGEAAISNDTQTLNMSKHQGTGGNGYTTHELVGPVNTIKEFVDDKGIVFAVSWHGVARPDLRVLLGKYYSEYKDADAAKPKRHTRRPQQLKTKRIVVIKSGRMRDLRGIAYIPARVPAGVNIEDLQ